MLHDSLSTEDRRHSARNVRLAEIVIRWHHDPDVPIRYPVLDMGDGGVRILSTLPLLRGLSGTAVKLLPKGEPINRPCSVAWTQPPALNGGPFEIGLELA